MAIKEIRREWSACQLGYVCEFMLHTEKDVKDLPICCVGSVAHVSETNTDYVCTGKRWVPREAKTVVILPETALARNENGLQFSLTEPLSVPLTPGMNCTVTYNGVEYKCTAQEVDVDGAIMIALGNVGAATGGEDTGEPFVFVPHSENTEVMPGAYAQLIPLDGAESVTISITAKTELVNESENAGGGTGAGGGGVIYIAETIGAVLVTATAYADEACTTALTYEQGKAIISKPFVITSSEDGMTAHAFPLLTTGNDADKTATVIVFNPQNGTSLFLTLTFADTPT